MVFRMAVYSQVLLIAALTCLVGVASGGQWCITDRFEYCKRGCCGTYSNATCCPEAGFTQVGVIIGICLAVIVGIVVVAVLISFVVFLCTKGGRRSVGAVRAPQTAVQAGGQVPQPYYGPGIINAAGPTPYPLGPQPYAQTLQHPSPSRVFMVAPPPYEFSQGQAPRAAQPPPYDYHDAQPAGQPKPPGYGRPSAARRHDPPPPYAHHQDHLHPHYRQHPQLPAAWAGGGAYVGPGVTEDPDVRGS